MSGASEPCCPDKNNRPFSSRPAAARSKEPKICANPSSHVISQPSISSTACQVLVLVHRPAISILGPDGPSYPPAYLPPMFADLKTIVPNVMYIVAPCVPSNAAQICSQPPNILSTQCGHDLQPDSRQPGVSMPAVYNPTPDLTTCTGETDITPNSRPAPHSETRHPGFDHHEGLA